MKKILFICKRNECYGSQGPGRKSAGLYNSTQFIVQAFNACPSIKAYIVEVQDNNDIDSVVHQFKPHIVIIEALWVVPEKFEVLEELHPGVKWYVHLHSHMPFLALEGIAISWILGYADRGVGLIANSRHSYAAFRAFLSESEITYLPNIYNRPARTRLRQLDSLTGTLNVACFGAVRPLKNHLLQALAALEFAADQDMYLNFHINSTRIETGGEPVLKNLIALFKDSPRASLICTGWQDPVDFVSYLQHHMDIGMQVSLSETFNVVAADYATAGLPLVVSKEVEWAPCFSKAKDNSVPDIVKTMHRVWHNEVLVRWNQRSLRKHSEKATQLWLEFVRG